MTFKKPNRQVNKVFIHCSASDRASHDNIDTIRRWHTLPISRNGRGFSDVGYHYLITKNGGLQEGRPLEAVPAAQKGHNTGSIAICLSGKKKELFTQDQFDSLIKLCTEINRAYIKITFHGHCEVSKKACPVFDYKEVLNLDEEGLMLLPTLPTQPKKKMALPLLLLATPFIKKLALKGFDKLKGTLLDKAKKTVIEKILEKTGINLGNDLSQEEAESKLNIAMNSLSPEQLLELKKEIIESDNELRMAELESQTEHAKIINETMKAEMKADDSWQKRWRPFNGFAFGVTMLITLISYVILGSIALANPEKGAEMLKMLSELIFATSPLILGWSAVLGVSSYTRGKEKLEKLKRFNL